MDPTQALARALENVMGSAPSGRAVGDIRDMYGSNAALAHALVQDSGPVSQMAPDVQREYKTWMRDIQRWTTETGQQRRTITQRSKVEALERVGKSRMQREAARQLRDKGAKVRLAGVVVVSKSRRQRDAMPDQEVSPETMGRVLDQWESGEWEARDNAFSELEGGFFDQYEMPGIAYMDDVSELQLEIPQ